MKPRFKIDFYESSYAPFALYHARRHCLTWLTGGVDWYVIERNESKEPLIALYEKVKDLPEYLD
jgi:hypothetical protein